MSVRLEELQARFIENTTSFSHPIRFVHFEDFSKYGGFPRFPNNESITQSLDSIDRNNSLLVFISHCWLRGHDNTEGWDGSPHPDNAAGDKYRLCCEGIKKLRRVYAPRVKDCYVWMDYCCVDQDNRKNLSKVLKSYDKIVEVCDCLFTPVVNQDKRCWDSIRGEDILGSYSAVNWNQGPAAYLNRAWCRVEMLYAAMIPVLENSDADGRKRHTMFEAGLTYHCSQNRRPHFIVDFTRFTLAAPYCLPPLQHSYLDDYHPLKGHLTVESDIHHIRQLVSNLQPYIDSRSISVGYSGDTNEDGEPHGRGILMCVDGGWYEGEWNNGTRHGHGVEILVNGDKYEGSWENGSKVGRGTCFYSNGSVYEGDWFNGHQHGQGRHRYADGSEYSGESKNNVKCGCGVYTFADGELYEGEWLNDLRHGQGRHRYADGSEYNGEWKNDKECGPYCGFVECTSKLSVKLAEDESTEKLQQIFEWIAYLNSIPCVTGHSNRCRIVIDGCNYILAGFPGLNNVDGSMIFQLHDCVIRCLMFVEKYSGGGTKKISLNSAILSVIEEEFKSLISLVNQSASNFHLTRFDTSGMKEATENDEIALDSEAINKFVHEAMESAGIVDNEEDIVSNPSLLERSAQVLELVNNMAPKKRSYSSVDEIIFAKMDHSLLVLDNFLGEGTFAEVYACMYDGEPRAVKKFRNFSSLTDREVRSMKREAAIMKLTRHENIISFVGFDVVKGLLVFERASCSLHSMIHIAATRSNFLNITVDLVTKVQWLLEIIQALRYLHFHEIIHRDVKPSNVLLFLTTFNTLKVKVSDFGVSSAVGMSTIGSSASSHRVGGPVGSYPYNAPELLTCEGEPVYSPAVDIYSFGILANEVMSGNTPWTGCSAGNVVMKILKELRPPPFVANNDREKILVGIVGDKSSGCLSTDPSLRPSASDLIKKLQQILN